MCQACIFYLFLIITIAVKNLKDLLYLPIFNIGLEIDKQLNQNGMTSCVNLIIGIGCATHKLQNISNLLIALLIPTIIHNLFN